MKYAIGVVLVWLCAGCARQQWPEPPRVEPTQYLKDYEAWRSDQQNTARESSIIVGIWPLRDGETAFGSDTSLPIVLPAPAPGRAGVFHRSGEKVTVTPAQGVTLHGDDGKTVTASTDALYASMALGSLRLLVAAMEDGRVFMSASDEAHPLLEKFPGVQTYPIDQRWRVAARFDAFEQPKMMKIADVRGGTMDYPAVGQLTFRIGDEAQRLTAFGFPDSKDFFVMFKDATNATTTYGYRIVGATIAVNGEWTVLDFNMARNPPCAYSPYTTCPLPPPENRLAVAIEAGEKRFPTGKGFVQQ